MNYEAELLLEARKAIEECSEQRSKIIDLLSLAIDEIEDGGSPSHEYELFQDSVEEIKQRNEE